MNAEQTQCVCAAHTKGEIFALEQGREIQSAEGLHEIATTIDGIPVNIAAMFHGTFSDSRPDLGADPEYTISSEESYANARRLAACWNACAGISTAALEEAAGSGQRVSEMLLRQRDELLEAIEKYLGDESETTAGLHRAIAKVGASNTAEICGRLSNGHHCQMPKGHKCPDCGLALHDVPEGS